LNILGDHGYQSGLVEIGAGGHIPIAFSGGRLRSGKTLKRNTIGCGMPPGGGRPRLLSRHGSTRYDGGMESLGQSKHVIRREMLRVRATQPDKDAVSRRILDTIVLLPEYAMAKCVLFYVDVRCEVRTRFHLPIALGEGGKRIAVPYCRDGELEIFELHSMQELRNGAFGIREPDPSLRGLDARRVAVEAVDLVLVPGVAFSRRGARLGHGNGYYDRLLPRVRRDAWLVAPAFERQLVRQLPVDAHDVFVQRIVTERAIYAGLGG
jgi:5-formyltetrahydrofolate cyclo-ligase